MLENYCVLLHWLHVNNTPVLYTDEMIKLYLTTYKTNQQYTVHESRYIEMMNFDLTNKTNK